MDLVAAGKYDQALQIILEKNPHALYDGDCLLPYLYEQLYAQFLRCPC